ncbi:MAG TPA: EFR1 family ferrodoxin [Ruminiclostridium sp.]|nr:EFR1 family ferrodoxin [Ruminiclostridium sp.]
MKKVKLVYFSGTGGTERFTLLLEKNLKNRNCEVQVLPLEVKAIERAKKDGTFGIDSIDIIVLLFPVHAFDAPEPVYSWIKTLPLGNGLPAAVISVSAGGEYWMNKASRYGSIKALTLKGYDVLYERMVIMPFNMLVATSDTISMRLLQVLPIKAENTAAEILSMKPRRTFPPLKSRVLTYICKTEKIWAKFFGKELTARKSCTHCGLCAHNCPGGNIQMKNGKPQFGWHCIACLRCIYTCPANSIYPRISRFMVVRGGYDLKRLEKQMESVTLEPDDKLASGSYSIFKDYLQKEDT